MKNRHKNLLIVTNKSFFSKNFFVVSFFLFFIVLFHTSVSFAASCMTREQVSSDTKCLYIVNDKVYQKGTRDELHQGHPCGTDVTSVIPSFHMSAMDVYMNPFYVGDVCKVAPPTDTPMPPQPTDTPVPTNTPEPEMQPTSGDMPTPTKVEDPLLQLPVMKDIDVADSDLSSYEQLFTMAYSSVLHCFGDKYNTPECTDKKSGDIDNDGAITEVDYNLILIGFDKINKQKLLRGIVSPTPTPGKEKPKIITGKTKKTTPTPVAKNNSITSNKTSLLTAGIILTKFAASGSILCIFASIFVTFYLSYKNQKKKQAKQHAAK